MIAYRRASLHELEGVLEWAAQEGWNPGIDDAQAFYAADPKGFFVATHNGAPVASVSVVNHNAEFAFLGLYIVAPSYRGKGIGYALWQHALDHAGTRTIGLDGVPAQQENYVRSGFKDAGATTRFTGRIAPESHEKARLATEHDVAQLVGSEGQATGITKDDYLSAWFKTTRNRQTFVMDDGFCTVRRCRNGSKVGPILARDKQTALGLLKHAASVFGPDLSIDVPSSAFDLADLCKSLGFETSFETTRMYRGPAPINRSRLFGVASLELG